MTFSVRPYEARTARWWFTRLTSIDMEPSYQRRGLTWDRARQAFLIDSILNDFDIPKLYLADFSYFSSHLNERSLQFAVVDGKQRLSAIFNFLSDELVLNSDFVLRATPERELGGLTYSGLRGAAPDVAERVDNFNLPVMSVITDDEEALRELFVRLNSGKPLSSAELRNAQGGIVPALVRALAQHEAFTRCVAFSNRAGAHEQAAAKLLLIAVEGDVVDTKRKQLDLMYEQGSRSDNQEALQDAYERTLQVLNDMTQVFVERDPLLRSQGQLPVYFLLVAELGPSPDLWPVLSKFDEDRRAVDHVIRRGGGDESDLGLTRPYVNLLLEYGYHMRNPNDARSIRERLLILRDVALTRRLA